LCTSGTTSCTDGQLAPRSGDYFLGGVDSDLVVSITITGDAWCRASDKTYRVDTPAARGFLDDYVALP
jgi:hypothetical protein